MCFLGNLGIQCRGLRCMGGGRRRRGHRGCIGAVSRHHRDTSGRGRIGGGNCRSRGDPIRLEGMVWGFQSNSRIPRDIRSK